MESAKTVAIEFGDPKIPGRIEGRSTVLLDTNVWIDLAEPKTDRMLRLQERIRELVNSSMLFCPLTFSTISEVFLMKYSSAARVASLMENLSLNIAFAPTEEIFKREVGTAFSMVRHGTNRALGLAEIFVPVIGYLCTEAELHFSSKFREEHRQRLVDLSSQYARHLGFVELIEALRDLLPMPHEQAPAYAATARRRKEVARGDKERARRVEEEAALRNFITPHFQELQRGLAFQELMELRGLIQKLPKDQYGGVTAHLLKSMPAIRHYIDVMTVAGYDPGRKDQSPDFFDLELITAPFVYSDILVTRDRRIRHILTLELRSNVVKGKQRLWTYDALEHYLENPSEVHETESRSRSSNL